MTLVEAVSKLFMKGQVFCRAREVKSLGSVPNFKILLSCADLQTTKYLITTVSIILKFLSFGSVREKLYVYM